MLAFSIVFNCILKSSCGEICPVSRKVVAGRLENIIYTVQPKIHVYYHKDEKQNILKTNFSYLRKTSLTKLSASSHEHRYTDITPSSKWRTTPLNRSYNQFSQNHIALRGVSVLLVSVDTASIQTRL